MKIKVINYIDISIMLILMAIPFSYFIFLGFRVFPFLVLLGYFFILLNLKKVAINYNFIFYIFMVFIVFAMCFYTQDFFSFFSILFFFLIAYWPLFVEKNKINFSSFSRFVHLYIFFGALMGGGVIIQYFLYTNWGLVIGNVGEFSERIGFGFIWTDYSFLSLYFTSIIPLVGYLKNTGNLFKVLYILFFLMVSLITTARTGFYAFVVFFILVSIFILFNKIILSGRFSKKNIIIGFVSIFPLSLFLFNFYTINKDSRIFSLDSSGRINDYIVALDFFKANMWLGSFYSNEIYRDNVTLVPHNLFIYNLVLGGVVFFCVFLLWLISILAHFLPLRSNYIIYSLIICLIGFQFVPAVFTAYFFAFLISLGFYELRLKKIFNSEIKI
ncbi:O-antigen polymerase [Acinetobacter sp. YT-02]|uniref:O-antigen polymerase n=1 Tax=Acinetobacter sp. YT-02 TaxID=2018564 RepID=UPI000BDA61E0|nr:O-antigen polymerase [Acinetobacter sp. YT-02]PCN59668.1 hypothetical protein CF596_11830 [Acinetobacter sp. YT-02]